MMKIKKIPILLLTLSVMNLSSSFAANTANLAVKGVSPAKAAPKVVAVKNIVTGVAAGKGKTLVNPGGAKGGNSGNDTVDSWKEFVKKEPPPKASSLIQKQNVQKQH